MYFTVCAFCIVFRKSFHTPRSQIFSLMFFSRSFIVLTLAVRPLICFELFFAQDIKVRANVHLLPNRNSVGPAPFLEKTFLFPSNCLDTVAENQLSMCLDPHVYGFVSGLFCLIYPYICSFSITITLQHYKQVKFSHFVVLLKSFFKTTYSSSLAFLYTLQNGLVNFSNKNKAEIFTEILLNPEIVF